MVHHTDICSAGWALWKRQIQIVQRHPAQGFSSPSHVTGLVWIFFVGLGIYIEAFFVHNEKFSCIAVVGLIEKRIN